MKKIRLLLVLFVGISLLTVGGCKSEEAIKQPPRLTMFIGVDISGSFLRSKHFDDAMDFLSFYIYAHLKGFDDLEVPKVLFVGSIGGVKADEPKTLYPIQTFQNRSPKEIRKELNKIFPKNKMNPFTDYNAFFDQVSQTVANKRLILRPLSIVMISDGKPDLPGGKYGYDKIKLKPLERLSRNITLRVLYTDAVVGADWQNKVKRKRVKVWTQDADVMKSWKHPKTFIPGKKFSQQHRFFSWLKDNVDFGVRLKRVE